MTIRTAFAGILSDLGGLAAGMGVTVFIAALVAMPSAPLPARAASPSDLSRFASSQSGIDYRKGE